MTNIGIELLKAWFIFSFTLGCWTCINLVANRRGDKGVKHTIVILIFLLLVPPLNAYVNLIGSAPVDWLIILSQKLTWAYGPVIVALIRHILLKPVSRLAYALQSIPFLLMLMHELLNLRWLSFNTIVTLLFIHVFCYLSYAGWLLKSERPQLLKLTTQFKNTSYYWLIYLVAGLFVIMLFDVSIYTGALLGHIPSLVALSAIASCLAVFVDSMALFSIYQPDVFFHEIEQQEKNPISEKQTLRSIELSPEAAKELDRQLSELVKNHKPHLDEDISLAKLSSLLGITTHHLSELLNIHKSISFYDFLNDLRYQESLLYLSSHEEELTISDIAYRSGFNNRNSFYKVFKEKTGVTPNQFKKAGGHSHR